MSEVKDEPVHSSNKEKKAFSDELRERDRVFALFYAKWCGFSRRFLPIFEEFSRKNPNECLAIAVDDDPDPFREYSIEYYPTVILLKNGKVIKRLDSKPGIGLDKKQLTEFKEKCESNIQ